MALDSFHRYAAGCVATGVTTQTISHNEQTLLWRTQERVFVNQPYQSYVIGNSNMPDFRDL